MPKQKQMFCGNNWMVEGGYYGCHLTKRRSLA